MVRYVFSGIFGSLGVVAKIKGVDLTLFANFLVHISLKREVVVGSDAVNQTASFRSRVPRLLGNAVRITNPFPPVAISSNPSLVRTEKLGFIVGLIKPIHVTVSSVPPC